jgi:hypothetical protein
MVGLVISKHHVGWGHEGVDLPCPSIPTARLARSRQRHHSKSGGAGRLWSKEQAPSRLNGRRSGGPMRPKLVGVAKRSLCGAGVASERRALPVIAFIGNHLSAMATFGLSVEER